jgi:hypothetical protein
LAVHVCAESEWQVALLAVNSLEDAGAKAGYLRGLAGSLELPNSEMGAVLNARGHYKDDIASLEKLLHQHALRQLFLEQPAKDKIERFNRTLNHQWAVEVKNGFNQTSV